MAADLFGRLLDFAAPRRCAVCGGRLAAGERGLCAACLLRLPRTMAWLTPADNMVARMFWGVFPVGRAAAFFYYKPHSDVARAIYAMKYKGRPDIGFDLGRAAAVELAAAGFFDGMDVLLPVPLARKRQRQRGYNQSWHIARGVASATGLPVEARAVVRTAYSRSQTGLTPEQRRDNVAGAFALRCAGRLEGRHALIVDDVVTTGATIAACAAAMAAVPGARLSVLTLGAAI